MSWVTPDSQGLYFFQKAPDEISKKALAWVGLMKGLEFKASEKDLADYIDLIAKIYPDVLPWNHSACLRFWFPPLESVARQGARTRTETSSTSKPVNTDAKKQDLHRTSTSKMLLSMDDKGRLPYELAATLELQREMRGKTLSEAYQSEAVDIINKILTELYLEDALKESGVDGGVDGSEPYFDFKLCFLFK